MAIVNDMQQGIAEIIKAFGSDFAVARARTRGVITNIGSSDEALINAYGLDVRVFYCEPLATKPKKFDPIIDHEGNKWTVQACHDIWISNKKLVHKCIITG